MICKTPPWRLIRAGVLAALLAPAMSSAQPAAFAAQPAAVRAQPAAVRTLSEQEMVDMMVGSSIQASRSTNSADMIRQVRAAIAQGRQFTMVDTDAVGDDWVVALPRAVRGG